MKKMFDMSILLSPETSATPASLGADFPIEIVTGGIIAMLLLCVVLFFVFRKKK